MRKKYLSALLFGALLFASAGTFTSCKDYDDDINNLQSQIDKLATKEDMEAKLSQMETAINDAKATAEEALKAAQEAGSTEEIAKLEARIKALEDAALDVDALKKEIADSVEEQMADFREEMEKLLKEVEELTGYSLDMVTGISFVASDGNGNLGDPNLGVNYARVKYVWVPENLLPANNADPKPLTSYTFGEGMTGAFAIKSGDVNTVADYMLVNVDPVDAAVSAEMLSLVNGKGQNLNEYLDLSISSWADDITIKRPDVIASRAGETTGLRKVGVQLKNTVDFEAFDKLVIQGGHHVASGCQDANKHHYYAYALAVTDAEKSRTVTSPFEVTLHVQEEGKATGICDATKISSTAANESAIVNWAAGKDEAGEWEQSYPVKNGETFQIKVAAEENRVMASYVEVDYNNKDLSVADKTALQAMTYSGVKTVVKDGIHNLKISGAVGIPVPLKLVTIDYTGYIQVHIVWVKAGDTASQTTTYTITPKSFVEEGTKWTVNIGEKQAFTIPTNATNYSVEFIVGETAHQGQGESDHKPAEFTAVAKDSKLNFTSMTATNSLTDGAESILKFYKADKSSTPAKASDVAYAEFTGTLNLQMMKEDKTYEGIVKFYDATGTYLGSNTIKVTKKLPTAVPADFSAKTNGIVDGVMTVYPRPMTSGGKPVQTRETASYGEYSLYQAFNEWTPNYVLNIDGDFVADKEKQYYNPGTGEGDKSTAVITNIKPALIGSENTYAAGVSYNYGKILYVPEGHGVIDTPESCLVPWDTQFSVKFGCWPLDSKYDWTETPVVYYREDTTIKGKVTKDDKGNVTDFQNVIKATTPYGKVVDPFASHNNPDWTTWADALNEETKVTLITVNNGKEVENEFFNASLVKVTEGGKEKYGIKLTKTGAEVKVGADIETKVILTITDKFGDNHTHDIPALTFTMKINHE